MRATVTGSDDVAILKADPNSVARYLVAITGVTARANERSRKPESIALCDPACEADVFAGTGTLPLNRRLARQRFEALDSFFGDLHG